MYLHLCCEERKYNSYDDGPEIKFFLLTLVAKLWPKKQIFNLRVGFLFNCLECCLPCVNRSSYSCFHIGGTSVSENHFTGFFAYVIFTLGVGEDTDYYHLFFYEDTLVFRLMVDDCFL